MNISDSHRKSVIKDGKLIAFYCKLSVCDASPDASGNFYDFQYSVTFLINSIVQKFIFAFFEGFILKITLIKINKIIHSCSAIGSKFIGNCFPKFKQELLPKSVIVHLNLSKASGFNKDRRQKLNQQLQTALHQK